MNELWPVILTMGVVAQLIVLMIKGEIEDFNPGYTYAPMILTIGLLILIPFVRDVFIMAAKNGEMSLFQMFMLGVAGFQALLIILKITISPDTPWWVTFLPVIICLGGWIVLSIIFCFTGRIYFPENYKD